MFQVFQPYFWSNQPINIATLKKYNQKSSKDIQVSLESYNLVYS